MHLRALLLTGVALAVLPIACTTKDENPDWSPGTDYPDWAYNAPVYLQPAEELQPQAKVGNNIPVYYTRDALFFVRHPQGKQQDVYPHVAVWGSNTAGRQWKKAGYFGLEQTHFLYKAEQDGGYWVRFVGPGQGVTEVPPGQPHRIYVVDTHAPDITMDLDPAAWYCPEHCGCPSEEKDDCGKKQPGQPEGKPCNPRCENARPHIYRVGDVVTLHWSVSDANLKKKTIKLSTCFAKFPHNLVWSEFPEALPRSGSIKITIPPEAAHQAGLRFRIVAEDLAGNIGIQMTDVMHVRGREGMPLEDQLAEAPPAYEPTDRSPATAPAGQALPDPDTWSPDRPGTAAEPASAQSSGEPDGSQLASGPARDAVPAGTPPHATPLPVRPAPTQADPAETPGQPKPLDLPDAGQFDQPAVEPKDRSGELLEPVELRGEPTEVEPLPEPADTPKPTAPPAETATEPTSDKPALQPAPEPLADSGSVRVTGKDPIDVTDRPTDRAPRSVDTEPALPDQPAPGAAPAVAETPQPEPADAHEATKPKPAPALPEMHEQRKLKELGRKLDRTDEPAEQVNPAISVVDSKARTVQPEPAPEPKDVTGPRIVLDADAEAASRPASTGEDDSQDVTKLSELVQPGQPTDKSTPGQPAEESDSVPDLVDTRPSEQQGTSPDAEDIAAGTASAEPVFEPETPESALAEKPSADPAEPLTAHEPQPAEDTVSVLDLVETQPTENPTPGQAPPQTPADVPVLTEAKPQPIDAVPDTTPRPAPAEALAETEPTEPTADKTEPKKLASADEPGRQAAQPAPPAPDQPVSDRVDWISPDGKADVPQANTADAEPAPARTTQAKPRSDKPRPRSLVRKDDQWGTSPIVRKTPRPEPATSAQPGPREKNDQPQLARRTEPQPVPGPAGRDRQAARPAPAEDPAADSLDELLEEVKAEDKAIQARTDTRPTSEPERSADPDVPLETDEGDVAQTRPEPEDAFLSPAKAQPVAPEPPAVEDKPTTRLSDIPEKVQQGWPARGMVFRGGVSRLLNWLPEEAGNYRMVKLQFSANDGTKWMTVADGLRRNQAVMWTVPVVTSNRCRLRIVAMDPKGKEVVIETSPRFSVDTGAWKTVDMSGFNPQIQPGEGNSGN